MRKIGYFLVFMLLISGAAYSQGEVEALKFSRQELYGTARSMAMGGAFGALGGDISGISVNPAGIGIYRSSEIVGTFGFSNQKSTVGSLSRSKNDFDMHNLGFVGYFPLRNEVMPMINFGFNYSKNKSFSNKIDAAGSPANSLIDYIADRSYKVDPNKLKMGDNLPDPFLSQPWLSVLAYNSWLINPVDNTNPQRYTPLNTRGSSVSNRLNYEERGSIDSYDFTIGTTIYDVLSFGFTLSASSIYNDLSTSYADRFQEGDYTMTNNITTTGAGVGAKLGIIYRPVHAIRFGFSYQTPTYYTFTEMYDAAMTDNVRAYVTDSKYESARTYSARFTNYYDMVTPAKLTLSAAVVLGNKFILSGDYEAVNYNSMRLKVSNDNANKNIYDESNSYIKKDFRSASTVRLGMEYRFTPALYGRLGYAWMQNPYKSDFKEAGDAAVSGSNTMYVMEGDANYFTGGFGYRFNRNFYADLAIVYKNQKNELYPFPKLYIYDGEERKQLVIDSSPFELKSTSLKGIVTVGFKF